MSRKTFAFAAALVTGFVAMSTIPVDAPADAQRRSTNRADLTYVASAGSSDQYEIRSSQLALQRSQRADVREFAQMMIADHNRTTEQVTAAARADGLAPPPPMLMPRHRTMLRNLERANGRAFDQAYLTQQMMAHQEALNLHGNRARQRDGSNLTRVANIAVPIVQGHYDHVRRLNRTRR